MFVDAIQSQFGFHLHYLFCALRIVNIDSDWYLFARVEGVLGDFIRERDWLVTAKTRETFGNGEVHLVAHGFWNVDLLKERVSFTGSHVNLVERRAL